VVGGSSGGGGGKKQVTKLPTLLMWTAGGARARPSKKVEKIREESVQHDVACHVM
jgi:hypothetical protein